MTFVIQSLFPGIVQIFGSKKIFSILFQNNNFFFQTQGYQNNRWAIETLKKAGTKLINDVLQTYMYRQD